MYGTTSLVRWSAALPRDAVDAFGVVVERAAGVDEHQHRRVAAVGGGEVVDRLDRIARPQPVRGGVELAADHHHRRQRRRRVGGEPGGRQVHQFAAVLEPRGGRADGDRHHGALGRDLVRRLHRHHGGLVGLVGQRARGELVPRGLHGGEVAHPQVQRQRRRTAGTAARASRTRRVATTGRRASPRPARRRPTPVTRDPDPQRVRRRVARQPLRGRCTSTPSRTARADASAATGSHTSRQRRLRQPMAASSTTAATTCTVSGSQPCISDRCCWR